METTLFIVRLVAPVMVAAGAAVLVNPRLFDEIVKDLIGHRAILFLAGILALVAGLAVVNVHNVWVADWPVIVTIFGWLAIVGGVVRMVFPNLTISIAEKMLAKVMLTRVVAAVEFALGAWLVWIAYF